MTTSRLGFDPGRLASTSTSPATSTTAACRAGSSPSPSAARSSTSRCYGWRDREAGLPVEPDTIWRIASMTKPVTSVAAMTLWEEGAFELTDPISKWIPSFADVRVYVQGRRPHDGDGARDRADPRVAPAHAHLGPHRRVPLQLGRRRALPRARATSSRRRRIRASPSASTTGRGCRCCSSRAARGVTACRTTCSAGSSRSGAASRSTTAFASRVLDPLGHEGHVFYCDASRGDRLALALPRRARPGLARRRPATWSSPTDRPRSCPAAAA